MLEASTHPPRPREKVIIPSTVRLAIVSGCGAQRARIQRPIMRQFEVFSKVVEVRLYAPNANTKPYARGVPALSASGVPGRKAFFVL